MGGRLGDERLSQRLLAIHRELEELFSLHGECLLERELDLARELLAAYRELLYLHMEHEEQRLLPRYADVGPAPRFPVVLYTGQHEKLRGMLEALVAKTAALGRDRSAVRRALLGLFDAHTTFKHLQEHHDGAERDGLFATLDAAGMAADDLADEWWTRRRGFDALVARARSL